MKRCGYPYIKFRHLKLKYLEKLFLFFIHFLPEFFLAILYYLKRIFSENIAHVKLPTDNDENIILVIKEICHINTNKQHKKFNKLKKVTYSYLWLLKIFQFPYYIDNYADYDLMINYHVYGDKENPAILTIKPNQQKFIIYRNNSYKEYDICFGQIVYPSNLN